VGKHKAMVRGSPKPALFLLCFVAAPSLLSVGANRAVSDASQDALLPHGAGLLEPTEGCEYPEGMGYQVGDKVRIYKPSAKINNVVTDVVCPESGHDTAARVCVSWGGCWPQKKLRKMSPLALALNALKTRAADVGRSASHAVQQKLSAFAGGTRVKVMELSGRALIAVNVCDPEVRAQVQLAFAALRARVNAVAYAAAQRTPAANRTLTQIAQATKNQILALGAVVGNAATNVIQREEVQALVSKVASRFDELKASFIEDHPKLVDTLSAIRDFFDKVGELSNKAVVLVKDAYQAQRTQEAIASIQSGAGKLLSAAAAKWPPVRVAIREFASDSGAEVAELGRRAFEAVNLCNPEVREAVKEQLQAALASIQSRVGRFATAVVAQVPVVEESLGELADSMSAKVRVVYEHISTHMTPFVHAAIAAIRELVAKLKEVVSHKTTAEMEGKARELAEGIQEKVAELTLYMTDGETSHFDDSEEVPDLWESEF